MEILRYEPIGLELEKRFDAAGPELENFVRNFEILDPDKAPNTKNSYCIGFKYMGGDPKDPRNWKYDHFNYWERDISSDDYPTPQQFLNAMAKKHPLTKDTLDAVFSRHSVKVEDFFIIYLAKVFGNE